MPLLAGDDLRLRTLFVYTFAGSIQKVLRGLHAVCGRWRALSST